MKRPRGYSSATTRGRQRHFSSSFKYDIIWSLAVLLCFISRPISAFQSAFVVPTSPIAPPRHSKIKGRQRSNQHQVFLQVSKQEDTTGTPKAKSARKTNSKKKKTKNSTKRKNNNNSPNNNRNNSNFSLTQSTLESKAFNGKLTQCESAREVLLELASVPGALTLPAGGGKLNSVNFSTAIHRIARHVNFFNPRDNSPEESPDFKRRETFMDPRFALFLCSMAEALGGVPYDSKKRSLVTFGSREVSNIAWALAKLRIVPPKDDSPLLSTSNYKTMMLDTAKQLRGQVMQVARARTQAREGREATPVDATLWVKTAALLCGQMMDMISINVAQSMTSKADNNAAECITIQRMAFQERANLLWATATAQRGSDVVYNQIMVRMVEDMEAQLASSSSSSSEDNYNNARPPLQPQEWSNSIWAFATELVFGEGQVKMVEFIAHAMETQKGFRENFKPQELSNTAYAVAKLLSKKKVLEGSEEEAAIVILRNVAIEVSKRAADFKTQELSNTLWAFATLGFGSSSSSPMSEIAASMSDYVILASNDPEGDETLVRQATDAILECALPQISRFKSQELNNVAWSLARLGRKDATEVVEAIGKQLCHPKRRVTSQDIGTSLWSMATLEYCDEAIIRGVASRFQVDRAHGYKPQELSNSVWAMATLEIIPHHLDLFDTVLIPPEQHFSGPLSDIDDPITLCFGLAAQELMRRPHEFKSQEIKDVLWSFSRVGVRHPDLFKATAEHLVGPEKPKRGKPVRPRGLDEFNPQGLGNTAWAFARQAQLVGEVNERSPISSSVLSKTGRMAIYVTSFFDLGEILLQRLFSAIADTDLRNHQNLSMLKPQDITNTAWAMAVLGMKHDAFMEAAKQQFVERTNKYHKGGVGANSMNYFKSQEVANLLWAFAVVNFRFDGLGTELLPYMLKQTCGSMKKLNPGDIATVYKRQELANIAWSCAVFDDYPTDLIKLLYCGLVGVGGDSDMQHLKKCFNDGGLQSEAIMSLIYLQLAMELRGETGGLFLPEFFPEGWGQKSQSSNWNMNDMGYELKLSTSRMQRDVSAAFERIGFNHVEEHVIPLEELLRNNGVGLAETPMEVLSIDLANVEKKIAIEVDGPAHYVADIETVPDEGGYPKVINGRLEYFFNMNSDRHRPNGATALKVRLLEQMGWNVINIPFWEWDKTNGDPVLEEEFCRRILKE